MKSKFLHITVFLLCAVMTVHSQLNEYKYVVVPKKFKAFKAENMHLTSTMVKHFFTENGFDAIYNDDLRADLVNDPCLAVTVELVDNSSLFFTKTIILLNDCEGKEVFRSIEGSSKEKEFIKAYKEALKESFVSFEGMNYKYSPKEKAEEDTVRKESITLNFKDDVKTLKDEDKSKVIEQKVTPDEQLYKSKAPVGSNMVRGNPMKENNETLEASTVDLTAQGQYVAKPVDNGYHLLDSSANIVLKLQETSMQDIFLTDYNGNNAVLFKKDDQWMLEYLEEGEKQVQQIQIKF